MELTVGQVLEGKITGITAFGVFVDIGEGKSGLVHISEVSRSYVNDLNEIVKVGDEVKVKILNIGEDGKISLSMKRALEPEKREPKERRERKPAVARCQALRRRVGQPLRTPRHRAPRLFRHQPSSFLHAHAEPRRHQ